MSLADELPIQSVQWRLERFDEMSGTGGGEILVAQLAPPRIVADVQLEPMPHAVASRIQAAIEALDGMDSFYLFAPQQPFPQADPDGTILGDAIPLVFALGANNKSIRIQNLPAGYTITKGDYLAFDYGSNPTRRAFHRAVSTASASSEGLSPLIEIRPHLRPGATVGQAVILRKPSAKVIIVPGSFDPGRASGLVTQGMAFQVMQRP